jgi:hypothetical protein
VGDCASRLDYFIEPIAEKCMADMESSDESNHPIVAHHIAPIFDDRQEQENLSSSMGVDDDVQNFICSTISVASPSVKSRTRHSSRPAEVNTRAKDGTQVCFYEVSSCNDDLLLDGKSDAMPPVNGSGYYIDGKGRKRRFSLCILATKKNNKLSCVCQQECASEFV